MLPPKSLLSPEQELVISLLEETKLLEGLDRAIFKEISEIVTPLDISDAQFIFDKGDPADAVYLIETGVVQIVQSSEFPLSIQSEHCRAEIVDLAVMGGRMRRTAAALAVGRVRLYRISRNDFKRLQTAHPIEFALVFKRLTKIINTLLMKSAMKESKAFTNVHEDVLDEISQAMEMVLIPNGTQIIKKDDPSDHLYFVINGRFLVIKEEGGQTTKINDIGRGEVIGEIGVILGFPRLANVRAVRDCTVGQLSKEALERILVRHPIELNRATTAMIVDHLVTPPSPLGSIAPRSIAIVPISPNVPIKEVCEMLHATLAIRGPIISLDATEFDAMTGLINKGDDTQDEFVKASMVNALNDLERAHAHLLMIADEGDSPWTQRCCGQADVVLLLGDACADPTPSTFERMISELNAYAGVKSHLLLMQTSEVDVAHGTDAWLQQRDCAMHHHLRRGNYDDIFRLGRFLNGEAIGVVLGAGGARGMAHIGVLRAMEELGIPIDLVGGTSAGAFIAGQAALGWSSKKIMEQTKAFMRSFGEMPTLPIVALFSGKQACAVGQKTFGDVLIEDLPTKFFAVSCNISRAGMEVHDDGLLAEAILVSNTAPGIYPPYPHKLGLLVDGASVNSVPVDVMAKANPSGVVIAINVNPKDDVMGAPDYTGPLSGWSVLFSRLNPFKKSIKAPGIIQVLMRVASISGTLQQRKTLEEFTSLYLEPSLDKFSIVDYKKIDQMADVGYKYAKPLLKEWKEKMEAQRAL